MLTMKFKGESGDPSTIFGYLMDIPGKVLKIDMGKFLQKNTALRTDLPLTFYFQVK